jgi:ABC-type sugar transport system ATPase subunit
MDGAASVMLDGVSKVFTGSDRAALENVSLDIDPGAFCSILGPSGCGKTTILRIIAGFEYPTEGRVLIDGKDVTGLPPRSRDIAMVFQDYALYPHMTVERNITFNLWNRRVSRHEISQRLNVTARTLGLEGLLTKKPAQLSGGERQRVALGRALIRKPRVFLMDEPLSNLDLKLREAMRIELSRLHQEFGITTIFVTHDQLEALTLSSSVAVMNAGCIQQVEAPEVIYSKPANTFVGRFIGSPSMNLFRMDAQDGWLSAAGRPDVRLPLPVEWRFASERQVLIGVRPHQLYVVGGNKPGIPVEVNFVEHLGRSTFVVCSPVPPAEYLFEQNAIQLEADAEIRVVPGERLRLSADPKSMRAFSTDGRRLCWKNQ